ncbi:MAG TPA: fatty acid--CoA ligase family protein [Ramlibacter sp.]|uniref:class I adenylate-forming enzyme family protein n=1 Tax=Ramlibacter sp. TaxID=1917967 RepID=UPI002B580EC1|nr:fatty acid--CoA ligase family protein [Ramlibacter sp.]HVZ43247.1 fatty acid--CoA ligase family protein [Ramlibacter sp.]
MNVIDAIRHHVRMRPHDLAVVHPGGSLAYGQLGTIVSGLGAKLRALGIRPGTTVAIYVNDPFLHLGLVLAAMLEGIVSVSAHPNFDPMPPGAGIDTYLAEARLAFEPAAPVITVASNWLAEAARESGGGEMLEGRGFADPGAVCRKFTSSGTTGTPKIVAHTSEGLREIAARGLMMEPISGGPNLSMMWLSTIGGFNTSQSTLWHGGLLVMATLPHTVLRAINLYRVRYLRASPQQLQALVELVRGRAVRFPSLERVEVGGASTAASTVVAARALLCPNVVGVYGSTEAGMVAQTPAAVLQAQPTAAGYVVPEATLEIVDANDAVVASGTEGIVRIRTPAMARRYEGDEEATARGFRDGWFYPGDLGRLGADGIVHITGRTDEMINAGGVKLSPVIVDDFLITQPGVREAAAFARRQPGRGDEVWAAVVCEDAFDEEAVLGACRARLNSRAPVRLVRVAEIPRNAMGKPLRQQLTQQADRF